MPKKPSKNTEVVPVRRMTGVSEDAGVWRRKRELPRRQRPALSEVRAVYRSLLQNRDYPIISYRLTLTNLASQV